MICGSLPVTVRSFLPAADRKEDPNITRAGSVLTDSRPVDVIATTQAFQAVLPSIRSAEWLALDTEADSLHAYPEKLCLVQLSLPGTDLLFDPLASLDISELFQALADRELTLHGGDYDLRLLYRTGRFIPNTIFDTMLAARMLGHREFGLDALVLRRLGVQLEKGGQKLNWARRPLSPRMETYARNDTHYLRPLAESLRAELIAKGRLAWVQQLCAESVKDCSSIRPSDPDRVWRIRGSDRLEPRGLGILRELWRWREGEAIARNRPPYFVMSHENLVALAETAAREKPLNSILPRFRTSIEEDRFSESLERALKLTDSDYPARPRHVRGRGLKRDESERFEGLARRRDLQAEALGIDPTLIASRATLLELAQDGENRSRTLLPWQREMLQ